MTTKRALHCIEYLESLGYRVVGETLVDPKVEIDRLRREVDRRRQQKELDQHRAQSLKAERMRLRYQLAAYWIEQFGIRDARRVLKVSPSRLYQLENAFRGHPRFALPPHPISTVSDIDMRKLARIREGIANIASQATKTS